MGRPNIPRDMEQAAQQDSFAHEVDEHIQQFQPYLQQTGVSLLAAYACV